MDDVLKIAGGVVTAVTFLRLVGAGFVRTIGLLFDAQRRLLKLSTLAQVRYFAGVLGEPVIKAPAGDSVEYVFVHRLFYVHAVTRDDDESVLRYAVTTRSRWFRPKVRWWVGTGWQVVKLNRTTFAGFWPTLPTAAAVSIGARRVGYFEMHYFGNPGHYQTYVLAFNDAGYSRLDAELLLELAADPVAAAENSSASAEAYSRFRSLARPNTYAVLAPGADVGEDPWTGVDHDVVRILPM